MLYKAWAIDSNFFNRAYPILREMIERGTPVNHFDLINPNRKLYQGIDPQCIESAGYVGMQASGNQGAQPKETAIIPVLGTLTKRGDLSSYGMVDYIDAINKANANPAIDSIVLAIESPGGTVDGTPEFAKAVRESAKPVVAFGDLMVDSAAYWIASQAKAIFANENNYTEFGSVGTLLIYQNASAYIAKEIGSIEIIRAPQSKDKALVNPIEPLPAEEKAKIIDELKAITDDFISAVKAGRGDKLLAPDSMLFTGKTFDKNKSLHAGLIDRIGILQDAVNYAHELSAVNQSAIINPKQNSTSMKKLLSYLFGGKAEDKPKDDELSAEDLAELKAAEQKLAEMNAQIKKLQDEKSQLEADKKDLGNKLTEKDAEIANLKTELEKKPAGQKTTIVGDKDRGPENEKKAGDFRTSVDNEIDQFKAGIKESMKDK